MKVTGIIPARMGSSRYPGKPLVMIAGKTMIEHVYRRSALSTALTDVAVATPDEEIARVVRGFGGRVVMTAPTHERATDRVAEAAGVTGGDIVVVIQGDEPLLQPDAISDAVAPVAADPSVFCTNLMARIRTEEDFLSPNTIKVVTNQRKDALYFSRSPVPGTGVRPFERLQAFKQVCIIPFRAENLVRFTKLPPTILEQVESIDMLRILEHGYTVRMVETPYDTAAVDVPSDIAIVEEIMANDPVAKRY